jgi:hypothetical protein
MTAAAPAGTIGVPVWLVVVLLIAFALVGVTAACIRWPQVTQPLMASAAVAGLIVLMLWGS